MRRIENRLYLGASVAILAGRDIPLGKGEIIENAFGVGPLPEQVVVLEEVIVTEGGVRDDQRLHGHRVLLEQIGDTGAGVDHDLVGKGRISVSVELFLPREKFSERPMAVHQRHAERGIGIEHLLGRDDLDLAGIDVELEVFDRDLLDFAVDAVERGKIPFLFGEERRATHHAISLFLNSS